MKLLRSTIDLIKHDKFKNFELLDIQHEGEDFQYVNVVECISNDGIKFDIHCEDLYVYKRYIEDDFTISKPLTLDSLFVQLEIEHKKNTLEKLKHDIRNTYDIKQLVSSIPELFNPDNGLLNLNEELFAETRNMYISLLKYATDVDRIANVLEEK